MKEKIIIFFLGLFLGAVISTGSIYFYTLANSDESNGMQMQGEMDMNNQNGGPGNMQAPGQGTQNETSTQSN